MFSKIKLIKSYWGSPIVSKKDRFIMIYQLSIFYNMINEYKQWKFRGTKKYINISWKNKKIYWALKFRQIACWIDDHHYTNTVVDGYETCGYRCGYKRKLSQNEIEEVSNV